jgi:rhodanese-related sulfurtransferase
MDEGFGHMDFLKNYWPMLALVAWFGYKWWNARRVVGMLPSLKQQGATLVDVRSVAEFANANAPGTVNIPLQELGARLDEIPRTAPVVLACASGTRSGMAKMMLKKHGYPHVYNIGVWSNFMK